MAFGESATGKTTALRAGLGVTLKDSTARLPWRNIVS